MERSKYILMVFMIVVFGFESASAGWKGEIYQAYIDNRMDRWKEIIDRMEREKTNTKTYLSQLVNYQYGYIGWCIGKDKKAVAKNYLELAERNLELLEEHADASFIHAYKSAFYGFKIGLSQIRAPIYGPRSVRHARLAIEEDKENPLGYIQYGNSQFYMPPIFGGSKEEAIVYFQKARELMERDPGQIKNDWNYLSLLTVIAQSYEHIGEYERAKEYFEKILKIEPEYKWVKDELYPQFLQKR